MSQLKDSELREQIQNCFKRNLIQTEGDTELFDTEITINELEKLLTTHTSQLIDEIDTIFDKLIQRNTPPDFDAINTARKQVTAILKKKKGKK